MLRTHSTRHRFHSFSVAIISGIVAAMLLSCMAAPLNADDDDD